MLMITTEARRTLKLAGAYADPWLRKEKVTLAGSGLAKAKPRKLKRERFERMLNNTIRILKAWQASKFEYEASCYYGIRSGLCLEGWSFSDADRAAAEIVATALARIGAVRPRWEEGQIDFAMETPIDREQCLHCSGPIPDDRRAYAEARGRSVKYCGDPCQRAAMMRRQRISGEKTSMAEFLAACAVKSQRTFEDLARNCDTCGKLYFNPNRGTKYCSFDCRVQAVDTKREFACEGCGTVMKQTRAGQRFCGRACANRKHRSKTRFQCEEITT